MIKHIVMWRLKEHALGANKEANALQAQAKLEALKDLIPEILELKVGRDLLHGSASWDLALYAEFQDLSALETYQNHPAHQDVAGFIGEIRLDRAVVDFE